MEQQFSDKLRDREIQPSGMAWDRLDAMLSVAEKNKKPKRGWLYMAAGFLALLLVGSLFLKQEKESNEGFIKTDTVVNAGQPQRQLSPAPQDIVKESQKSLAAAPSGVVNKPSVQQAPAKADQAVAAAPDVHHHEAAAAPTPQPVQQKYNAIAVESAGDEAEKLLAEAITAAAAKKKSTIRIDAGSLLSNVEGEINENFRSKVLQGAIRNFNAVKTSVANRNYQ